jgi:hypothetical protein
MSAGLPFPIRDCHHLLNDYFNIGILNRGVAW